MKTSVIRIDVRDDIRAGREPFSRIMTAVAQVGPKGEFILTAPFEPAPLYEVLGAQGFTHTVQELPGGGWEIHFLRGDGSSVRPAKRRGA
jgi:hypothetical protein